MLNNIPDISRGYFFTLNTLEQTKLSKNGHISQTEEGVSSL